MSELCLSKVVDLAVWLATLEEKLKLLEWELNHLREAVREMGISLGLETQRDRHD